MPSRGGSSLSKRFGTSSQNFKPVSTLLPAIEGAHEEGITTEDVYNPKVNMRTGSRVSSARPLFSNFSAKTLKKNVDHATNLVKNYGGTNNMKSPE